MNKQGSFQLELLLVERIFLVAQMVKNLPAKQETGFSPWVGKIFWRREWQSHPVFLPGKSHGQRSLVGYSSWGRKESDTTERLTLVLLLTEKPKGPTEDSL